jgi:hypothetical protein
MYYISFVLTIYAAKKSSIDEQVLSKISYVILMWHFQPVFVIWEKFTQKMLFSEIERNLPFFLNLLLINLLLISLKNIAILSFLLSINVMSFYIALSLKRFLLGKCCTVGVNHATIIDPFRLGYVEKPKRLII